MEEERLFPPKPEEPLQSDCCGTGCVPCVFDIYEQELILWEKECERIKSVNEGIHVTEDRYVVGGFCHLLLQSRKFLGTSKSCFSCNMCICRKKKLD